MCFPTASTDSGKVCLYTDDTNLSTTEDDIKTIRLSTFPIPFKILPKTIFIEHEENTTNPIFYEAKFEKKFKYKIKIQIENH